MALYSSTLIIKFKTNKSDSELLKSLKLHVKANHHVGKENVNYNEVLAGDANSVYLTTTEDFVIIAGLPLVLDFIHVNAYSHLFPDAEFFFMFNESVSMLNGFVYGKGSEIFRRKYVQDGKYFKAYDISPDTGEPLKQEKEHYTFDEQNKINSSKEDYMFGVNDFDISMKFLSENFMNDPGSYLEKLKFNRDFSEEFKQYIESNKIKVEKKEIDGVFLSKLKELTKELKFKKNNFPDNNGKLPKNSFYKQINDYKIFIGSENQFLQSSPLNYSFSIELKDLNDQIKTHFEESNLGIPIISIKPSVLIKLSPNGNDYLYTKNDLNIAEESFIEELEYIKTIIVLLETQGIEAFFSNDSLYQYCISKLLQNVQKLGRIWNRDEVNYCLLYYFYNNYKSKSEDLIRIVDQISDEEKKTSIKTLQKIENFIASL